MKDYRIGFLLALIWKNIVLAVGHRWLWYIIALAKPIEQIPETKKEAFHRGQDFCPHPMAMPRSTTEAPARSGAKIFAANDWQISALETGKVERKSVGGRDYLPNRRSLPTKKATSLRPKLNDFRLYPEKCLPTPTYQYVRKGQPLFTIYSPRSCGHRNVKYLVASRNQQASWRRVRCKVSPSAQTSLLSTAKLAERLKSGGAFRKRNRTPRIPRARYRQGTGSRFAGASG